MLSGAVLVKGVEGDAVVNHDEERNMRLPW
jgi:hypothetical protein